MTLHTNSLNVYKLFSNSPTQAKASPKNAQMKKRSTGPLETQSYTAPMFQPGSMPLLDDLEGPLPMPVPVPIEVGKL